MGAPNSHEHAAGEGRQEGCHFSCSPPSTHDGRTFSVCTSFVLMKPHSCPPVAPPFSFAIIAWKRSGALKWIFLIYFLKIRMQAGFYNADCLVWNIIFRSLFFSLFGLGPNRSILRRHQIVSFSLSKERCTLRDQNRTHSSLPVPHSQ